MSESRVCGIERRRPVHEWTVRIAAAAGCLGLNAPSASPALADALGYGAYQHTSSGDPAVLADIDPGTGAALPADIIVQDFGAGSVAPLQYELSGLTYGDGQFYGLDHATLLGYPAVLLDATPGSGAVLSNDIIGQYFGESSVAQLQQPSAGLAYIGKSSGGGGGGRGGTPIPEPATITVLISGLIGLGAGLARRAG
jgi:hypothetical protein